MKKVEICQISVMLEGSLPASVDYEQNARTFFEKINKEIVLLNAPVLDKNAWNALPPEVPRIICSDNNSTNLTFAGNNVTIFLKCTGSLWDEELTEIVSALSDMFENIGKLYGFNYRFGVVLTINIDKNIIQENVEKIMHNSILEKKEWKLSFLDTKEKDNLSINNWKRYIYNENEGAYKYIIDVNTSAMSTLNLRNDKILDVFKIVNEILHEAYYDCEE